MFITEDPGTATARGLGDDIWVAPATQGGQHELAEPIVRFASLTDCSAEPTGIYFDLKSWALFVHAQHRGGDGHDLDVRIERTE